MNKHMRVVKDRILLADEEIELAEQIKKQIEQREILNDL